MHFKLVASENSRFNVFKLLLLQDGSIRVDLPSAVHLDTPYTIQPGGCGDPGEYIHVTRNYILNLEGQSTALFGPPGKSNRMKH